MGLGKTITGPYNIELGYHKINRILYYSDDTGVGTIQLGSYRNRQEASAEDAKAIKVAEFPTPDGLTTSSTIDEIKEAAYILIKEHSDWSDATDVFEEGQNE